jgi:hypothetical protein
MSEKISLDSSEANNTCYLTLFPTNQTPFIHFSINIGT